MRQPDLSANAQLSWQSQIGPTKYPSWGSLQTDVEKYWNLQQAVGTHQSVFHSNSIDLAEWDTTSYIIGMNLCKVQSDDGSDNFSSLSASRFAFSFSSFLSFSNFSFAARSTVLSTRASNFNLSNARVSAWIFNFIPARSCLRCKICLLYSCWAVPRDNACSLANGADG